MEPLEVKPARALYVYTRGKAAGFSGTVSTVAYGAALTGLPVDVAYLCDAPASPWDEEWIENVLGARLTPGAKVIRAYLPAPEKPRFRFRHRMAGKYHWEPVNTAAMALSPLETSTPVASFWGDRTGLAVTIAGMDRAAELGMTRDAYREHVRTLTVQTRAKAAGFTLAKTTREELDAANAPAPVRVSISEEARAAMLAAPLITREELARNLGHKVAAGAITADTARAALGYQPITREEMAEHFPDLAGLIASIRPPSLVDDILSGLEPVAPRPLPVASPSTVEHVWASVPAPVSAAAAVRVMDSGKPRRRGAFLFMRGRA